MTLKEVAYHEAGHAVMHVIRDIPFERATIIPTDDFHGSVKCDTGQSIALYLNLGQNSRENRALAIGTILCYLAGPAAEERLTGRYDEAGASHDMREVEQIALYYSRNPERYIQAKMREARQVIHQNWRHVDKVAKALLEHQTVDWSTTLDLLGIKE